MPRVVPSQVVDFIDSIPLQPDAHGLVRLNSLGAAGLSATLDLVNQIPEELLTMNKISYGSFVHAKAVLGEALGTWTANHSAGQKLQDFRFSAGKDPLARIREALAKCPDQSPAPGTSELSFITDNDLRANLRNDVGAINRALTNGEWKAATVLAGSAAEALLLWALKQRLAADIGTAVAAAKASGELTTKPDANLDRWNLHEYIEVAAQLGTIKPNTAKQTRLAKDFRNFIHPGVAQRLGEKCDRATALWNTSLGTSLHKHMFVERTLTHQLAYETEGRKSVGFLEHGNFMPR
jgi:hypothetical protein